MSRQSTYQPEPDGIKWPSERKVYTAGDEFSKRKEIQTDPVRLTALAWAFQAPTAEAIKGTADLGFSERLDLSQDDLN